jgi:putative ABC transport system permease protein
MSAFLQELRIAFRSLKRAPVLSIVVVLTLGLGIGMNALMFSLVYGGLYRGLPFPEEERIVRVNWLDASAPSDWLSLALRDYVDIDEQQTTIHDLAGMYTGTVNLSGVNRPVRYEGVFMTPNGFESLQVQPILGRTFTDEEGLPGAPLSIILGHHVWESTFASDPGVLGQSVRVNGEEATVVGVMPDGFRFPDVQDVWVPYRVDPYEFSPGEGPALMVYGRLAPGVSVEQAATEFTGLAERFAPVRAETDQKLTARIRKYSETPTDMKLVFLTLLATTILVLMVACTNVANLLLARAASRTKELAVNLALGASRARIMSKLIAEAVILVGLGALLGVFLGWLGLKLTFALAVTSPPPFWFIFKIDGPVLLFVVAASGLAAFIAGVVPGLRVTGANVSSILKDEGRGSSSIRVGRLSRLLVISELAFSVALLVSAGLLVKGMVRMRNLDQGIFQEELFTARLGLFETDFPEPEDRKQFFIDLQEHLRTRPEITTAALTSTLPGLGSQRTAVGVLGAEYTEERDYPRVGLAYVSPGFFETFGVNMVAGRDFGIQDDLSSESVAIVNQSFATRLFPGEDPLGRQFRSGTSEGDNPWRTIVGVVPDMYMEGLMGRSTYHPSGYYVPLAQADVSFASITVTGHGGPQALGRILQEEVSALHADTPLYWMRTMATALREEIWYVDLFGGLFAVFGGLALLLAAGGLYAVMATSVAQRTREVGIRMALGAKAGNVLTMVLRQGTYQMVLGLLVGLVLAGLLSRGLQSMLFGVEPWDISVFLAISGVMLASGFTASVIPARRATKVDPVEALRSE